MAVTSNRSIIITQQDDVEYSQTFEAETNPAGSGQNQVVTLASGNNTITVPDDAIGVTIIPPTSNAVVITLKGVNADTGISLALNSPTSIGLNEVTSFVLNAASEIEGVRLIYS